MPVSRELIAIAFVVAMAPGLARAQGAAADKGVNEVAAVEVLPSLDIKLSVTVGGDVEARTFVSSAPAGMDCGGAAYRYATNKVHQCWLWVRRNREVMLAATAEGLYGKDWTVAWSGCEPVANGAACRLTPRLDSNIAAVFTRAEPIEAPATPGKAADRKAR